MRSKGLRTSPHIPAPQMIRQAWRYVVMANSKATGNPRLVLMVLSNFATFNGYVGLSSTLIARLTGLGRDVVRRSLNKLVASGELDLCWKRDGRGKHNVYQITVPAFERLNIKALKTKLVPLPKPTNFPSLRVLEEPQIHDS